MKYKKQNEKIEKRKDTLQIHRHEPLYNLLPVSTLAFHRTIKGSETTAGGHGIQMRNGRLIVSVNTHFIRHPSLARGALGDWLLTFAYVSH
jgi:hypothetical protein